MSDFRKALIELRDVLIAVLRLRQIVQWINNKLTTRRNSDG